jgi:hypothetical protein
MGRKQKRQEIKRTRNHISNKKIEEDYFKVSTTIKIILAVVVILLVLYYFLAVFVTKEIDVSNGNSDSTSEETDSTDSVVNKILASTTFRQSPVTYYVYYYDFDDENEEISSAISNLTDYTVYKVDTGSSLNKNYVSEDDSNKDVTDISNLKVKSPTIIKIDNDKVVAYHEGVDDIISFIDNE